MDLIVIDNGGNTIKEAEVEVGIITRKEIHVLNLKLVTYFEHINEVEFGDGNKDGEFTFAEFEIGDKFEEINADEFGGDSGYESSESDNIYFSIENENILDDVEFEMNDFKYNFDRDAEWVGEENEVGELNKVLNNEVLYSRSSLDEADKNDEANLNFMLSRQEGNFILKKKIDKNRVRVVCRGTIVKLGNLENSGEGQQEVNNGDEEKFSWKNGNVI
uniref:Uncharacterized protein n=1 Tax=Lactuca sativa TaxID=4236 RepID=A0A9R1VUY2_LACSA|nr:hypothetical protein LSAT_V11C400179920 [Lactuca sativa]